MPLLTTNPNPVSPLRHGDITHFIPTSKMCGSRDPLAKSLKQREVPFKGEQGSGFDMEAGEMRPQAYSPQELPGKARCTLGPTGPHMKCHLPTPTPRVKGRPPERGQQGTGRGPAPEA